MYAPPPRAVVPVVPVAPPRRGGFNGPLLAICCLALILFLIAATIILALIPIYIPTRDAKAGGNTQNYYIVMTPNHTLGDDGTLSPDATTSISTAMDSGLNFPSGSTQLDTPQVLTQSSKRKRRGFGLSRDAREAKPGQNIYSIGRFRRAFCGLCRLRFFIFTIIVSFVYGGILQFFLFTVYIFLTAFSFPSPKPSSTSTISSSSTSTTSTTSTSTGVMG